MKARQVVRASRAHASHIPAFELMLKELTFRELMHLSAVLQRGNDSATYDRVQLVRKELDGRRFVYLQPDVVAP